jgi:hypothetical protein
VTAPKPELALMAVAVTSAVKRVISYVSYSRSSLVLPAPDPPSTPPFLIHAYLPRSLYDLYLSFLSTSPATAPKPIPPPSPAVVVVAVGAEAPVPNATAVANSVTSLAHAPTPVPVEVEVEVGMVLSVGETRRLVILAEALDTFRGIV